MLLATRLFKRRDFLKPRNGLPPQVQRMLPPSSQPWFRRLLLLCSGFYLCSMMYCVAWAAVAAKPFEQGFVDILTCVSKDWLLWWVAVPFLGIVLAKLDIYSQKGRFQLVSIVVVFTVLLGVARVSIELFAGGSSLLEIILIYFPRYLFITGFVVAITMLMIHVERTHTSTMTDIAPESPVPEIANSDADVATPTEEHCIQVMKGRSVKVIQIDAIQFIRACGNYLELQTTEGCYLQRNTLKTLEQQLTCRGFVRVHRSYLVNQNCIDCVCLSNATLSLHDNTQLPVGKTYANRLPHFQASPLG